MQYELTDFVGVSLLNGLWKLDKKDSIFECPYLVEKKFRFKIHSYTDKQITKKTYLMLNYFLNNLYYFLSNKSISMIITAKDLKQYYNMNDALKFKSYIEELNILKQYYIEIYDITKKENNLIISTPIIEKILRKKQKYCVVFGNWLQFYSMKLENNYKNSKCKYGRVDYSEFLSIKYSKPKCMCIPKRILCLARANENKGDKKDRKYEINKYLYEVYDDLSHAKTEIVKELIDRINNSLKSAYIQIVIEQNEDFSITSFKNGTFQIEYLKYNLSL